MQVRAWPGQRLVIGVSGRDEFNHTTTATAGFSFTPLNLSRVRTFLTKKTIFLSAFIVLAKRMQNLPWGSWKKGRDTFAKCATNLSFNFLIRSAQNFPFSFTIPAPLSLLRVVSCARFKSVTLRQNIKAEFTMSHCIYQRAVPRRYF